MPEQTIAVLGAGRSGLAAAKLARKNGAQVLALDSGDPAKMTQAAADFAALGCEFIAGPAADACGRSVDLAVMSPGIELEKPVVTQFSSQGIPVIGEIEYGWRQCTAPVVAITGTNGKTTTTEMVEKVFDHAGFKSVSAGNYGTAFCEIVASGAKLDVISLEVSSFQLETLTSFRPKVSLWLNFAPDHQDRYPDVESYRLAKMHIFDYQTEEDFAVVQAPDLAMTKAAGIRPKITTFTAFGGEADYTFDGARIHLHGQPVFDFTATRLRGHHNAENVMATLGAAAAFGLSPQTVFEALTAYTPPAHRCELVRTVNGHEFINDSKATNLHALESSLRGQAEKVILIAGGKDKGLDYTEISGTIASSVRHAVLIGEMAERIASAWSGVVPCTQTASLEDAVEEALRVARPKERILFSPGTSSFDMFKNYAERGDVFRAIVNRL